MMHNIRVSDRELSIILFSLYRFNQDASAQFEFHTRVKPEFRNLTPEQSHHYAEQFWKDLQDGSQLYNRLRGVDSNT